MPHEIRVPRLGWSMEEGTFVGWLKRPGEEVSAGQPLFELEGEKALQEIESIDAGVLCIPPGAPQPGSVVPIGTLLGYLLAPGESMDDVARLTSPTAAMMPDDAGKAAAPGGDPPIAPSALQPREAATGESPVASPRARRLAAELGVDWTALQGTGRNGRIREADVRAATAGGSPRAHSDARSLRRKAIAGRLRLSRERTIPVTLTTVADATSLVALRAQYKSNAAAAAPSYTDIVAHLAAQALTRHPRLAVRWDAAHACLVPVADDAIHIGIAVDTPDGLLVPVVRDAARKTLADVAEQSKSLIERARGARLSPEETQGGALTITSLGALGIDAFTPIINYPEVVILGLGAIRREPVVMPDDHIAIRHRITLSLTFDHAAVDGAPAAAFLRDIAGAIEAC